MGARRITVRPTVPDAAAKATEKHLRGILPAIAVEITGRMISYVIESNLSQEQLQVAAKRLTNPVIEQYHIDRIFPPDFTYAIEIGYLPGVTDNAGRTAKETIEDATGYRFQAGEAVYSAQIIFLRGSFERADVERIAKELHNPLIERATIISFEDDFPIVAPKVVLAPACAPIFVDLDVDDEELARIGSEGILGEAGRRGPLALSVVELKAIRTYFKKEKRKPSDVELESIAASWSEHCKHTIFHDPLDYIKKGIYREYIKGATEKIRKKSAKKGPPAGRQDFCVSVFKDNAGAIRFDKEYLITHKVETHNSPSGLDPFGGAVTGIGGVNRDAIGFGLGAKPIANIYGFCVGDPENSAELFRDAERKQALLPTRRILEGVVRGVNVGGNRSGIPTPLGFVAIHPSFKGKPLVFCGTVGLIPQKIKNKKSFEKKARPGDYIVMIGGRVGQDGIHGATFSSESLSGGSPATAVQIGDPITQKKFSDALIREARDKGLYRSITDNGAGGLSGSVGEMARESGGCDVNLDAVPLKYPNLAAWQIWLSESQERMTLAVPKKHWSALQKICARHDVEATVIGTFTKSGRVVVRQGGKKVMDVSLSFLHDGRPIKKQRSKRIAKKYPEPDMRADDLREALLALLARPSIGSTSFISRQYDHEVLAQSVTKPLQGRGGVNTDAAVLQPLPASKRGVVLAHGYCPEYSHIDTYHMAAAAIDTAVRNAVCAGASLAHLAILDNFCWSSSSMPERLYELKRAALSCFDTAVAYGTPFISGKDSMFNDFRGYGESGEPLHIAALPTLLISAIGVIEDIGRAQTIDLKAPGDALYLIGQTNEELGASEYFAALGAIGNAVPKVDTKKNLATYKALEQAIQKGLVASAIGLSRGGLGVALAKTAIAGGIGVSIDISKLPGTAKTPDGALFSESQGRVLVSVDPKKEAAFKKIMEGVPLARIGEVQNDGRFLVRLKDRSFNTTVEQLSVAYRSYFRDW